MLNQPRYSRTIKVIRGDKTEAFSSIDASKMYDFQFKVVDLFDLIPSHDENSLALNPSYPSELQPRLRDRAASKAQILSMAKTLNASKLLHDSGYLDTGIMIVGKDNVVEPPEPYQQAPSASRSVREVYQVSW